ncbi:MAG: GNAT family N-acetyltransferase [Bacteroidota bacterium]
MNNQKPNITFRTAVPADLPTLKLWDEQAHVIASDPDSDWSWETELSYDPVWREQLMVELDERPLGFIQIIDPQEEESHYWGEVPPNLRAIDIWIGMAEDLGKGYGTVMMRKALDRCFADPKVTKVLIDPLATNVRAIRFYERLGFEFVEERDFQGVRCHVYQMRRERFNQHTKRF